MNLNRCLLPAAVLSALSGSAAAGTPEFSFPQFIGTSMPQPQDVAVADLNGDGALDIVVANSSGVRVSVFLGAGDGTFGPDVRYDSIDGAEQVYAEDMNGDGILDIIATRSGITLRVLNGNGDGTFQSPGTIELSGVLMDLADVNGDGLRDAIVRKATTPTDFFVGVELRNPAGGFDAPILFESLPPEAITTGDLNGDGNPDLALIEDSREEFTLYLGAGDGSFTRTGSFNAGVRASKIAIGDLNADGFGDVVVTDDPLQALGRVAVSLGNGDGTVGSRAAFPALTEPRQIVISDVTLDGNLDVVISDRPVGGSERHVISVYPGNGSGGLGMATEFNAINNLGGIDALEAGDLDNNGTPDLVICSRFGLLLTALLNEASAGPCGPADLLEPFGALDIDDVLAFLDAFALGDPAADLAAPAGTLNIDDVLAFLDAFAAGCP